MGVLQKYDFVGFFFFFMLFLPLWKLFIVFPMVSWFLATNNFLTTKHWTFVLDIFFLLNLSHGSLHTFHFKSMSNSSKVAQKVLQLKFLLQVSMFCWDSFENWTFSLKLRGADTKMQEGIRSWEDLKGAKHFQRVDYNMKGSILILQHTFARNLLKNA